MFPRGVLWFIAFKASRTGALFQSRNSGKSVPSRDNWFKRTGRIFAEYYLRIQYIRPLHGFGKHPRSSSFHFSGLALSLVLAADVPPIESEDSRAPFLKWRVGKQPHKLLHLTSRNPRIHHKHISLFPFLVHPCPFLSFHPTITRHAINYFVRRWT